jgi:hypothetical protein
MRQRVAVQFLLILTICADMHTCRRVHDGWFLSESACRKEASRHREAVSGQCVVVMKELDHDDSK